MKSELQIFKGGVRHSVWQALLIVILLAMTAASVASEPVPQLRQWIEEMKHQPRGPFARLRWFCEDGAVLAPEPYACVPHGGGVQHGEWTEEAKALRQAGFYIANVLAGGKGATVGVEVGRRDELIQILLERYLIGRDDGWIFRQARTYRGAVQGEDESAGARALLYRLALFPGLPNQDFLLLREAFRLLPGRLDSPQASTVRELSAALAEKDARFGGLRAKIHGQPEAADAQRVRNYALERGRSELAPDYEAMAESIDALFRKPDIGQALSRLRRSLRDHGLRQRVEEASEALIEESRADKRMILAAALLADLRQGFTRETDGNSRLAILEAGLVLEREVFRTGRQLPPYAHKASRLQQLTWLSGLNDANYGVGLISARQWQAIKSQLSVLEAKSLPLKDYYEGIRYLGRVPGWGAHWLQFHFAAGVEKLSGIEPLVKGFIPDRLRGSPMFIYSDILDVLAVDANAVVGVRHRLFGEDVGAALRPLNAGLARGRLYTQPPVDGHYDPKGIYVLPETIPELEPVAGILTQGEGNALSHVQLLAGNLGVPNVVVAERLLARLQSRQGHWVVLAVSPGGSVDVSVDGPDWEPRFGDASRSSAKRISPDEGKLELQRKAFISLSAIRAKDSGRIAGPKAANLGELKHVFPDAVTDGLVVPFGQFYDYVNGLRAPQGEGSLYAWMKREYASLGDYQGAQKAKRTSRVLAQIRQRILEGELGPGFRAGLKHSLAQVFGAGEDYSVFVRSDTNVEDLAGFTGAGLNLTLPNVRGFENLVAAIKKVWASPFTERAFAWRQQRMDRPERVFPSVLLLRSVGVDKSGVMLTMDPETGKRGVLSIAVNFGIGGAVQGQQAEELRIDRMTGEVRVLNDATSPVKRVLGAGGGLVKVAVPADGDVLDAGEIRQLVEIADVAEGRLPQRDAKGKQGAADIEFGFLKGQRVLFQIRPFLRDESSRQHNFLLSLDRDVVLTGSLSMLDPPGRH